MQLLTEEIRSRLPALYACFDDPDPVAQVMFFTPWGIMTWYAIEFDGEDTFFGLIQGGREEWLGNFSLLTFHHARRVVGLEVLRNPSFEPTPLSKLRHKTP